MNFYVVRSTYTHKSTIGDLLINHELFCHTLEDTVRPKGEPKIYGETAIPAGRYEIILSMSNRFKRIMPLLIAVPGFSGVRIHGGNRPEDTHGCILVAKNIIDNSTIQGTMEKPLTELLGKKEKHFIEIIDTYH